ncbi:MAG TPA: TetR/AcrR family transcriptional regulator [Thermodesulfovibrionales bacterium]|nr:TetR/AcrR family transcriptional regulator [Thermodesulfovibrionales bacterium]
MGVVEKRAKRKEEFRKEILDSAREIFINDGYDRFSMRKLAEKIDYSPTTIYIYFKNKDDLLFAICEEFFADFFAELNRIRSVSQDPIETLRQAYLYLVEFGLKNPNQYKVIFFTKSVYGTMRELVEKESMARNTHLVFKEMIRDCIKAGRLRELDEDVIAPALATASHGLVTMILYRPDFFNKKSDVIAHSLVDALLRGYQK